MGTDLMERLASPTLPMLPRQQILPIPAGTLGIPIAAQQLPFLWQYRYIENLNYFF